MTLMPPHARQLLGLNVHPLIRSELLHLLWSWACDTGASRGMFYTNAHVFNLASQDVELRRTLNSSDVLIVEGAGGRTGGKVAGVVFPEQLATMDWIDDFLEGLVRRGAGRVYLVGDEPGVADACGAEMHRRHPGLEISGATHGFFDRTGPENNDLLRDIYHSKASVLMVGMGTPIQEQWIQEHLRDFGVPLVLALGAMFRWYSGVEHRAPKWMRRLHAEWLHRLIKHPVRHFRRYVIGNPLFLLRCLRQRLGQPSRP